MPWFEGSHEETRTLNAPAETVIALLQDVNNVIAATKDVVSAEVDGGTVHFVMKEENYGVTKFKGDYRCTYVPTADGVTWTTAPGGNLDQSGEARVVARGDTCELHYREKVRVELEVGRIVATTLKPVVGPMMAHEVKDFVKRLVAPVA